MTGGTSIVRDLLSPLQFAQLILFGSFISPNTLRQRWAGQDSPPTGRGGARGARFPAYKSWWCTWGKDDFYCAGFTLAFAVRSVNLIQSLNPRLRRVVGYFTPAAFWGCIKRIFKQVFSGKPKIPLRRLFRTGFKVPSKWKIPSVNGNLN